MRDLIGIPPELQVLKWFNLILRQIDNKYCGMLPQGLRKQFEKTENLDDLQNILLSSKKLDGTIVFTSPESRLRFSLFHSGF